MTSFFATGLHRHFSQVGIKDKQAFVQDLHDQRPALVIWVSQLGMLSGTAVSVNAGSRIGQIETLSGILSPGLILSLALLGVFPLAVRRILAVVRDRKRRNPHRADSRQREGVAECNPTNRPKGGD